MGFDSILAARAYNNYIVHDVSGSQNQTLTVNGAAPFSIEFTGAITAAVDVIFPATMNDRGASWLIFNNTSGDFALTVRAATGNGVVVTQGRRSLVLWDGTHFAAFPNDPQAGLAASGVNRDITSLQGITSGITMSGGLNVAGALRGNASAWALGRLVKSVAGGTDVTLTETEYNHPILEFTGALTDNINVIVPLTSGAIWIVYNQTSGSFTLTVKGATGTGVTVTQGSRAILYSNGTNVVRLTHDVS